MFLLGNRHDDVLDRDNFNNDIADLFAGAFLIELSELPKIDRIDQRVEDGRFGGVVFFGPIIDLGNRLLMFGCGWWLQSGWFRLLFWFSRHGRRRGRFFCFRLWWSGLWSSRHRWARGRTCRACCTCTFAKSHGSPSSIPYFPSSLLKSDFCCTTTSRPVSSLAS